MKRKRIALLGCTGSIGSSTLEVVRRYPELFEVIALSAHSQGEALRALAHEFQPEAVCLSEETFQEELLPSSLPRKTTFHSGREGLLRMIAQAKADMVVNGIAGASGLSPSLEAVKAGSDLALANKETLVMAGPLLQRLQREHNSSLLPVDSEHSALFFLTQGLEADKIEEIILTASGGPFRQTPEEELSSITPEAALQHPTWKMGTKITIDSATLANKGLEVIEAARLFPVHHDQIKVLIHPQSRVHSLVRWTDGTLYAQISEPSMELPIQNALTWPHLKPIEPARLDLAGCSLSFEKPDTHRFPMLALAYEALRGDEAAPIVYNAANEEGVAAFLNRQISFCDIPRLTRKLLHQGISLSDPYSLDAILETDRRTRAQAQQAIRIDFS